MQTGRAIRYLSRCGVDAEIAAQGLARAIYRRASNDLVS
jgi:hypothetical protein